MHEINSNNVDDCVSKMNNTIYDYFQKAYGNIKNSDVSHYRELYKEFSKHQLKSEIKNLKKNCESLEKIKLQLQDAIYQLRFFSNSLIHILSLSIRTIT